MHTAGGLDVQLLGDFCLVYDGAPVKSVVQARVQALLAYLLVYRSFPQPRERIAFTFWPDTLESQARANLRQLLFHLRRALPAADQYLEIESKSLQWRLNANFTLDVAEFENALALAALAAKERNVVAERAALESAAQSYRGDLLPGCYEEWVLRERERLRQAYLKLLESLVDLTERQRDLSSAIDYARRLLREDPLQETTCRHLMRLHTEKGDRASALLVYRTFATLLESELGVEPSIETQKLYQSLSNMTAPWAAGQQTSSSPVEHPTLTGRDKEWSQLRNAWQRAAANQLIFAIISGEPGTGKTRLAEELLTEVNQQCIATIRVRASAVAKRIAFAPLIELLRADLSGFRLAKLEDVWLTELARLMPELLAIRPDLARPEPLTESWQRQRLYEALARAILVKKGPLLLFLDDLHLCDRETLEWLFYLLRRDTQAGILILATMRSEEVNHGDPLASMLLDLRIRGQMTEIELGPLTARDTLVLAEQITAKKLDAASVAWLYSFTEGNPLFLVETLRAVQDDGDTCSHRLFRPKDMYREIPGKVQNVIEARLRQLSPSARELARVATIAGRVFSSELITQASRHSEGAAARALDELCQRRILRHRGDNLYTFTHGCISEVVRAGISVPQQQVLDRRVKAAQEQAGIADIDSRDEWPEHLRRLEHRSTPAEARFQASKGGDQHQLVNSLVIKLLTRALLLLSATSDNGSS